MSGRLDSTTRSPSAEVQSAASRVRLLADPPRQEPRDADEAGQYEQCKRETTPLVGVDPLGHGRTLSRLIAADPDVGMGS